MATLHFNPADPQQFDLYDAEHTLDTHRHVVHFQNKRQARAFIDTVLRSAEWRALGGPEDIKVVWTRHDAAVATCYAGERKLCLPGWAYSQRVILHEMAHLITRDHHGPVFAGTAMLLYRRFISIPFADEMETCYAKHSVEWRRRRFRYKRPTSQT